MTTPHESLFELKDKVRHAKDAFEFAEWEFYGAHFGSKKQLAETVRLEAEYEKLRREYLTAFYGVLEEHHGIKKSAFIKKGKPTKKDHRFTVLLGGRLLDMHAISTGQKITFFLGSVALGDNEKIELPAAIGSFPHVA